MVKIQFGQAVYCSLFYFIHCMGVFPRMFNSLCPKRRLRFCFCPIVRNVYGKRMSGNVSAYMFVYCGFGNVQTTNQIWKNIINSWQHYIYGHDY